MQGRVLGLLIGMSGALPPAGTLAGGVVAGVVGAAAATGVCADRARRLDALRRPADHAAEVAAAPGGP